VAAVCQLDLGWAGNRARSVVRVGGDLAYTVGIEPIEATLAGERGQFEGRVTNIYRREEGAGRWCIITLISPPRCRTS
jgi:ketosteroid isomerase-like protein